MCIRFPSTRLGTIVFRRCYHRVSSGESIKVINLMHSYAVGLTHNTTQHGGEEARRLDGAQLISFAYSIDALNIRDSRSSLTLSKQKKKREDSKTLIKQFFLVCFFSFKFGQSFC